MVTQKPESADQKALEDEVVRELEKRTRNAAYLFYLIAGSTFLDVMMRIALGGPGFSLLLGAAHYSDELAAAIVANLAPGSSASTAWAGGALELLLAALFAALGYFAARRVLAIQMVGLAIYMLDFFIPLVNEQWIAVLFHLAILGGMLRGIEATRRLGRIQGGVPPLEAAPEMVPARRRARRIQSFIGLAVVLVIVLILWLMGDFPP